MTVLTLRIETGDQLVQNISNSFYPWRSPDALPEHHRVTHRLLSKIDAVGKTDTQAEIDMCLCCNKNKCTNCILNDKRRTKYAAKKVSVTIRG